MKEVGGGEGSQECFYLFLYILNEMHACKKRRKWERGKGNVIQRLFRHSKMDLLFPLLSLQPRIKIFFRNMLPCAAVQGRSHMLLPYPGPSSETQNLL